MLLDTRIWVISGMRASRQWLVLFLLERPQSPGSMRDVVLSNSKLVSHVDLVQSMRYVIPCFGDLKSTLLDDHELLQ
jgi:hypothetical protein